MWIIVLLTTQCDPGQVTQPHCDSVLIGKMKVIVHSFQNSTNWHMQSLQYSARLEAKPTVAIPTATTKVTMPMEPPSWSKITFKQRLDTSAQSPQSYTCNMTVKCICPFSHDTKLHVNPWQGSVLFYSKMYSILKYKTSVWKYKIYAEGFKKTQLT